MGEGCFRQSHSMGKGPGVGGNEGNREQLRLAVLRWAETGEPLWGGPSLEATGRASPCGQGEMWEAFQQVRFGFRKVTLGASGM